MESTPSEDNPITLRDYAKHRLMDDMIDSVRKKERANNEYIIMVMDKHTRDLFAGICNLFEIMSKNVFHLENLELDRKDFPNTPAIYFVSPTQGSMNKIMEDFADRTAPKYESAHIFFSTKLSQNLFENLSTCEGLAGRVKSFCELNVDINLYEDNIFHLKQFDSMALFHSNPNDVSSAKYLSKIGIQLFTVCAVLNEKPYIQYYGKSKIAEKVAKSVANHFDEYEKASSESSFKEPRGTLIILDRSFDMTAPLLHDFAYESLVFEAVKDADEADQLCSEDSKQETHGQSEKMLDRTDLVWHRYKNKHFANVSVTINNEISRFVQENKNINAIKKGDELGISDLKDVLSGMPKYQELLAMYSKHLNLCLHVDKNLKARNFMDLIRVEQMIISGLTDSGKEVTNKDILKEIESLYRNLETIDHVRLLMIYFICYEVPEKDMDTLLSTVDSSYHDACYNLRFILGGGKSGLIRRRVPVMDTNEFRDYSDRLASTEYEILKTTPAIAKIAQMANDSTLDQGLFPYIGDQPDSMNKFGRDKIDGYSKMKGRGKWRRGNKKTDPSSESKLIIFVLGGLSHHEIVALNTLQENKDVSCIIVQGGNSIVKPDDFVEQVKNLADKTVKANLDGMQVDEGSIIDADQIGVDFT